MKIEEALYRMISFNNVELPEKATAVLPEQTPDVDSYAAGESLERLEQEVFQVLKDVTRDLMDGINKYAVDNGDTITTGSAGVDALKLELAGVPVPESDVLVLLISGKGEDPENPLKVLVAYKTDEPSAGGIAYQETAKNSFIDAVVESAKKYAGISTESTLVSIKNGKGNNVSEDETGYVVGLPFVSPSSFLGSAGKEGADMIEGAPIESRAINGQQLLTLYRSLGNNNEFFEKLSTFAVDLAEDMTQKNGKRSVPAGSPHIVVIYVEPTKDNTGMVPGGPDGVNAQAFQGKVAMDAGERAKNDVTGEAVSNTAFGGQEISNSPVTDNSITNSPLTSNPVLPANMDMILKRLALFVDHVNTLLDEDTAVDEMSVDTQAGGEPGLISEKLQQLRLQMRDAGTGPVVQAAVKKIIFENEEFRRAQVIGLSIAKNNLLRLDMSTLEGTLASNREETLNTLKGLGSSLYERINYFVHPYAGIYADDKQILQLRGSQKDEGALLLDKQLNKEQGGLEKRLNELQLLIERSSLLKQWFTEDNVVQVEDNT